MISLRCKMCGGNLKVIEGQSSCTCEFCGTHQTIPTVKDEKIQILFNRANILRMKSEFDKAAEIYEQILQLSDTEAEVYWGLILCKYGIEYVEDPEKAKQIPTCHRVSYDAVVSDEDYRKVIQYADHVQRDIYEQQAVEIDKIQKDILALAEKEAPYDVFICYKEEDESGRRTEDSVIANNIYYQLTREGFKVFYAAITLEDKLGTDYEPYIFSALNTARVMLALGTKPEYFEAVWVRNEWSRFLKSMRGDRSKLLIPCYRDMDPYELPDEFAHLQAQDMGRIGFINDIIRGIKKASNGSYDHSKGQEFTDVQQITGNTTAEIQVRRGTIALEDDSWDEACRFFERALKLDSDCVEAYMGKLLAKNKSANFDSWLSMQKNKHANATAEYFEACPENMDHINSMAEKYAVEGYVNKDFILQQYEYDRGYYSELSCRKSQGAEQLQELADDELLTKIKQYAKGETLKRLEKGLTEIRDILNQRIEQARKQDFNNEVRLKTEYERHLLSTDQEVKKWYQDAVKMRDQEYQAALKLVRKWGSVSACEKAIDTLKTMNGYKDSNDLSNLLTAKIKRKKKYTYIALGGTIIICAIICILIGSFAMYKNKKYNTALGLMDNKQYEKAIEAFEELNNYRDSKEQIDNCKDAQYDSAVELMDSKKYKEAIEAFKELDGYKDADEQIKTCEEAQYEQYTTAMELMNSGDYEKAIKAFGEMNGYKDAEEQIAACKNNQYDTAVQWIKSGDYIPAYEALDYLGEYKDSIELKKSIKEDYMEAKINSAEVGSTVYFGTYEQDGDTSDGKEDIEWFVLEKEETHILVISKYALDCQPYDNLSNTWETVTWEECSLRQWLNSTFLEEAFTSNEQSRILSTDVSADDNSVYGTSAGEDTKDKVFLLSISEAESLLSDSDLPHKATNYAISHCVENTSSGNCSWWLRSPGKVGPYEAYVRDNGSISYNGEFIDNDTDYVCPSLWINQEL